MVPLALIPDVLIIQKAIDGAYKIRIACWISAIIFLFAAFMLSWWILLGLIATIIIEVRVANSERRSWMFLSSLLLSLEILTNDFAGWGTSYPSERSEAFAVLGDQPKNPRSTWLDFYLPRRGEFTAAVLRDFGPALDRLFEGCRLSECNCT
jgi:hypothetical protein